MKKQDQDLLIIGGIAVAAVYLLPKLVPAITGTAEGVGQAVQGVGQGVGEIGQGVGAGILGLGTGVGQAAEGLGYGIYEISTGAGNIGAGFSKDVVTAEGIVEKGFQAVARVGAEGLHVIEAPVKLAEAATGGIVSGYKQILQGAANLGAAQGTAVRKDIAAVTSFVAKETGQAKSFVAKEVTAAKTTVNKAVSTAKSVVSSVISKVTGGKRK
jgi:hypothetical protein